MPSVGDLTITSMFMPDAWTSYTPTWTASTTNPVIGNGSLEGKYIQLGSVVWAQGKIRAGSTTTFGAGEYHVGLPVSANLSFSNGIIGNVWIRDASGADHQGTCVAADAGYFVVRPAGATFGASASWDPTHPVTLASGDFLSFSVFYEAA